jgi:hypothetical protein
MQSDQWNCLSLEVLRMANFSYVYLILSSGIVFGGMHLTVKYFQKSEKNN